MHANQSAYESFDSMCLAVGKGDVLWQVDAILELFDLQGWTTVLECSGLGMDRPLDFIEGSISNHLSEHPFFDSHRLANSR